MEIKIRNGVLGLETSKQVMVSFLILAVTGIAVILALTSLQASVSTTVDNVNNALGFTNESDNTGNIAFVNATGYHLANANSSTNTYVINAIWGDYNQSNGSASGTANLPSGVFNVSIASANYTVNSSGWVFNTTNYVFPNTSISYNLIYTVNSNRTASIIGNVSGGLVTFFGSTGTIFSILIVVVIILAISIIIWAVGRFGNQTEGSVNL